MTTAPPQLIVILGTFERLALLQEAIASIRRGVGVVDGKAPVAYEIVVVDGGSVRDSTRQWLADQDDIVFLGHRGLRGAVEAYNHAFAYAVDRGAPFVAVMNDDCQIVETDPGALIDAIGILNADPGVGAVAFAFDLFTREGWDHDHVYGLPYVNYGVFRREAGMAAARAQGDSSGRRWWNPIYYTYAADCELGVWVWKLGWKIHTSQAIRVSDRSVRVEDGLRDLNRSRDPERRDTRLFYSRWQNESLVREPAAQPARPVFGGLEPSKGARRVLITGGTGFLGRRIAAALIEDLSACGIKVAHNVGHDVEADTVILHAVGSADADLRDPTAAALLFDRIRPDIVIHAAATVGGIGANVASPVAMFTDNMAMGVNVLAQCARHPVRRVVMIGTTCSYPVDAPVPFTEASLWHGAPESTNASYGVAKRALLELTEAYRREVGLDVTTAIPANLYGEGDTFDDTRSHVIAAMLKKIEGARLAGEPTVVLWGTGQPTRDFLHVEDAARGIVRLAAKGSPPSHVNLGTGVEVTMQALAFILQEIIGYRGTILWDVSKPDGQPRRAVNAALAAAELDWRATVSLLSGLQRLVEWYRRVNTP